LLGGLLTTPEVTLSAFDATAELRGQIDLVNRKLALAGKAGSQNAGPLLAQLGLPELAKAVDVPRVEIGGTFERPTIKADGVAQGMPLVPKIEAGITYAHAPGGGRLDLRRLEAEPFGGTLSGKGAIVFGGRPRFEALRLDATRLDLGRIPGLDPI